MVVLLADRALIVTRRAHPFQRDARGVPHASASDQVEVIGPHPGAASDQGDGSWALRIDPRAWPVRAGDTVTDGERAWVLTGTPILHALLKYRTTNYIEARATLDPPQVP